MAERSVVAVAFDVNETLFSLDTLGPVFGSLGLDPATVPLWFSRLLRDGFALAAMGGYQPFTELAAQALRDLDPATIDDEATATLLSAFRRLNPHPDVEPALRDLRDAGVPAATLTNGSAEVVAAMLDRAGLTPLLAHNLSVDAVRRWKPAPEPYLWAARQFGLDPGRVALVAAHPWDCAGAHAAGLVAGWVNRSGVSWPAGFPEPDVTGPDLPAVVSGLIGR